MTRIWVANTDLDWFDFLASQPDVDEVNFWQPSGSARFAAINQGDLFAFKLKSPRNAIGGFGVFSQASNAPLSLAWEAFGVKNGAASLSEMRARVGKYRSDATLATDCVIGCRVVVQPVFLPPKSWIPQPESWAKAIVVGKTFDTSESKGRRLWEKIQEASSPTFQTRYAGVSEGETSFDHDAARFGEPRLIKPRLGQGAFRLAVTDAYARQCAISGGKVLPALEAAHIRSHSEGGEHDVTNGILLRRDIHSVFDSGYITFDDDYRLVVSDRVRTDFNNGNEYRRLHGNQLLLPPARTAHPNPEHLAWHRENIFLG